MPATYQLSEPTTSTEAIYMNLKDHLNLVITSSVQLCCDHPEYFTPRFPSGHSVENGGIYKATTPGIATIWDTNPGSPCLPAAPPAQGRSIHITSQRPFERK